MAFRGRALRKLQIPGLIVLAVLTVAAVVAAVFYKPAPPADDADVAAKAAAYSKQVQKELADAEAAYQASRLTTVTFPKDAPLRYMVAGDSVAGGYYSSTEAKSFRAIIRQNLAKHGPVEEVKASQAGANLSTVGGLVGIPENLGLAVIELGTNDTAGKTPVAEFRKQYDTLLRSVKKGSPKAALVCVGPWGAPGAGTDPYDTAVEDTCKLHGGQFVKISTLFHAAENRSKKGEPSWLGPADDFHPNDAGHLKIASSILERLKVV